MLFGILEGDNIRQSVPYVNAIGRKKDIMRQKQ